MTKMLALLLSVVVACSLTSCGWREESSVIEESVPDINSSETREESLFKESSEASHLCLNLKDQVTASELHKIVSDESGFPTNDEYDEHRIKVSGYLSGTNAKRNILFMWYGESIGDFAFYFDELPDINPLCNYFTIEGICSMGGLGVSFNNCTLISQETKKTDIVFWENGNNRIHFGNNCLAMSVILPDNLKTGTWDEAISSGCTEVCLDCIHTDNTLIESVEKTVYWTSQGNKIHTKKNCPTISNSDNVLEGDVSEAHNAGLYDYCERCS